MRSGFLVLGIAALVALCWSDAAVARLAANGVSQNGKSLNGLMPNAMTLRAIRLALPDGTELMFR